MLFFLVRWCCTILMLTVMMPALNASAAGIGRIDSPVAGWSDPVVLTDTYVSTPLGLKATFLEDRDGRWQLDDVMSDALNARFEPGQVDVPVFGFNPSVFWARIDLHHEGSRDGSWLLELAYVPLQDIDVYLVDQAGARLHLQGGANIPVAERPYQHHTHAFPLPLRADGLYTLYIRVGGESSKTLPIRLWRAEEFSRHASQQVWVLGLFFGVMLGLLAYNFFIFIVVRERAYLWYVLFQCSFLVFGLLITGMGASTLGFSGRGQWWRAVPLSMGVAGLFSTVFMLSFLGLKDAAPRFFRRLCWVLLVPVSAILVSVAGSYHHAVVFNTVFTLFYSMVFIFSGCYAVWLGLPSARYYLLAWLVFLAGVSAYALRSLGLVTSTHFTEYGQWYGLAVQSVLLSLAMASSIQRMKAVKQSELFEVFKLVANFSMMSLNDKGIIETATSQVRSIFGKNEGEVEGLTLDALVPELRDLGKESFRAVQPRGGLDMMDGDDVATCQCLYLEYLAAREAEAGHVDVRTLIDGEWRLLEIATYKLMHDGKIIFTVLISDITKISELKAEKEAAQEALVDQLQNESHRLEAEVASRTEQLASAQQELVQREKMASLGVLAAGVAHEINNPNNFVSVGAQNAIALNQSFRHFVDAILDDDVDHEVRRVFIEKFDSMDGQLALISEGSKRISTIVSGLQSVTQLNEAQQRSVDVIEGLDNTVLLLEPQLKKGITFHRDFRDRPLIFCWPAELNQVFMNLLINACMAIADRHRTDQPLPEGTIHMSSCVQGDYLEIIIRDNGTGMSDYVRTRALDPFFTTRPVGSGSGLGLSSAHDVIKKHGGHIDIKSVEGQGTAMHVLIPLG